MTATIRLAWVWTCPECGYPNAVRHEVREISPPAPEDAAASVTIDGVPVARMSAYYCGPVALVAHCAKCEARCELEEIADA